MKYKKFAGQMTSVIAMGSTAFGYDFSQKKTNDILDAYTAIGGNFLDTAHVYGDLTHEVNGISERAIGNWLYANHNRDDMVIGTKGGHPPLHDMAKSRLDSDSLRSDICRSLDALMINNLDIFWLHRDNININVGELLETLNSFIDDGLTNYIGVSNWTPSRIIEANAYADSHGLVRIYANQPQFSLAIPSYISDPTTTRMDSEMFAMHLKENMPCVAFSSQAKGFFIKYDSGGENALSEKVRSRYYSQENLLIYERIKNISAATGYSVGAISLAYLTCQPIDVFPIVGVSDVTQVNALVEAGEVCLSPEQVSYLMPSVWL